MLGLDVAKKTLQACIVEESGEPRSTSVSNTEAGFRKLAAWLAPHSIDTMTVCLEATNVYGAAVTTFFYERQATVYVANPLQVAKFMGAELRRVKTDKADAEAIAHFAIALSHRLRPWKPLPAHYQELRDLVRHLYDLTRSHSRIQNQLEKAAFLTSAAAPAVTQALQSELSFYEQAITTMHTQIAACIKRHDDLRHRYALLTSAKGIGPITALTLMAEVPDMQQFHSPKQLAAYAGLTPRIRHSGDRQPISQPISKVGSARLRRVFYMAALTAKKHNPSVSEFAHRLQHERGKKPKVVIIAVARKLLHLAFAMEKHQTPFDPNYQKLQLTPGTV